MNECYIAMLILQNGLKSEKLSYVLFNGLVGIHSLAIGFPA